MVKRWRTSCRAIECVFAERRSLVYEVFARALAERFIVPSEK